MVKYVLQKTLVKHGDSINALTFTHDGSLFASGADDGLIIIFKGNGHGEEVRRFQLKAPITALLWHSRFGYTIIAGDACGDVHTICLNNSTNVSASRFCAYMDIDEISFTEKRLLSYFQQCLWPCSQHRTMWFITSHQLGEDCGVNQARNYGFVFLPYLSHDFSRLWVTNVTGSYMGGLRPASRPAQVPRTGRRAARTYGTIASHPRG